LTYNKDELVIKRSEIEIIDFNEGETETVYCCGHCVKFGFYVPLTNRVYPEGQPIPVDHDQWLQCLNCGLIVTIYEARIEPTIKNIVETSEPNDIGINQFLGTDLRKSTRKKRLAKHENYDHIKEPEIRDQLRKGATLLSYSEDQPT
jgi:hypothetical protein